MLPVYLLGIPYSGHASAASPGPLSLFPVAAPSVPAPCTRLRMAVDVTGWPSRAFPRPLHCSCRRPCVARTQVYPPSRMGGEPEVLWNSSRDVWSANGLISPWTSYHMVSPLKAFSFISVPFKKTNKLSLITYGFFCLLDIQLVVS
jgi:hypothetical protein